MQIIKYISLLIIFNLALMQVKPYLEPASYSNKNLDQIKINENKLIFNSNKSIQQYFIENANEGLVKLEIQVKNLNNSISFFIINPSTNMFIGPYDIKDSNNDIILTDYIRGKNLIIEINNQKLSNIEFNINIKVHPYKKIIKNNTISQFSSREEPIILLTGYWPPTNEMIRHFSQDLELNESGWQGENWENLGYDIISYFPTFNDPDCTSCGQGNGTFEVDYQDTSEDFWPIANSHRPIAIITFSRGYNNLSWELEYNAYNRTNWIGDYSAPTLPTPNPPDENEASYYLRNSNLPMNEIIDNITNLNLGLDPYIDQNGDPGHFVSEFMEYHGTWYRDLNLTGEDNCILGGHVHVGGQIEVETARLAANETVRTVINYLNNFIYTLGDVNSDDLIDILDLVIVMNYILGATDLTMTQTLASDLNEDGIINIQDIIILINIILNNS